MKLYGSILNSPVLRFDYSSNYAVDELPKRGLIRHGPYDSNLISKDRIKCAIFFEKDRMIEKQILIEGLVKGEGNFRGFKDLFKIPLEFIEDVPIEKNINLLIDQISQKKPDLVFAVFSSSQANIYGQIKSRLLANGIPSQMVTAEVLNNLRGRQYILENIALASYAKIGGTPWTVSIQNSENNLIIGVSRAKDQIKGYLVGFVTLFTNDGDFILMNSKAPVINWEDYVQGMSELVESAIYEYENLKGEPDNIILHFHKKPGEREIESIEEALRRTTISIPYAIIHLNEYSNYRLFDSTHYSYIPPKGLKVVLSSHEVLLLLDGRIGDSRNKIGVPRLLNIRIDKRSTVDKTKFQEIVKQIYDFSFINWRGFNSAAIPVTLNYSKLIARTVIEIGIQNWNRIVAEGLLRDKAWFL